MYNADIVKLLYLLAFISQLHWCIKTTPKANDCETKTQNSNTYGCTDSFKFCRACCLFELAQKNQNKNGHFLKLTNSTQIPNLCACDFCKKL